MPYDPYGPYDPFCHARPQNWPSERPGFTERLAAAEADGLSREMLAKMEWAADDHMGGGRSCATMYAATMSGLDYIEAYLIMREMDPTANRPSRQAGTEPGSGV